MEFVCLSILKLDLHSTVSVHILLYVYLSLSTNPIYFEENTDYITLFINN